MNRSPFVLAVSLTLLAILVFPPMAISAGRGGSGGGGHAGGGSGHGMSGGGHGGFGGHGGGGHGGFGGHGGGHRGFVGGHGGHRGFGGHNSFHHGFFNRSFGRFFPFGVLASPVLFYGWPGYGWPGYYGWPGSYGYSDSSDYFPGPGMYNANPYPVAAQVPSAPAPAVYSVNVYNPTPAPTVAPAVYEPPPAWLGSMAPTSPQGVVEYPGGRYELRGDGMTIAYRWVWIPNPPSGPPGSAPVAGPPAAELAPARRGTIYHWTDTEGVMHVTDRWETVPQRYRQQAKQNLAS